MSESLKIQIIWNDFRQGSKDALKLIYEENYSSLYYYGRKFTSDSDIIKDVIHELFIELIDAGEHLSMTNNIRFYLLKSLRNKLIGELSRKSKLVSTEGLPVEFNFMESIEFQMISNEIQTQIQNQVRAAIYKLSDKQQEIIYLRFYNELSYKQISNIFAVEIQTVRNLMSRALRSLKEDFNNGSVSKSIVLLLLKVPQL